MHSDTLLHLVSRALLPHEWTQYESREVGETDAALILKWKKIINTFSLFGFSFEANLTLQHLTETSLHDFLKPRLLAPRYLDALPHAWMRELEAALQPVHFQPLSIEPQLRLSPEELSVFQYGQLKPPIVIELARPFLHLVHQRALQTLDGLHIHVAPEVVLLLLKYALAELCFVACRVWSYEIKLNTAGQFEDEQQSHVAYRAFAERLNEPGFYCDFLLKYPVLARLLAVRSLQVSTLFTEVIQRLDHDRVQVAELLDMQAKQIRLTGFYAGLSDPHNGGQTVCLLEMGDRKLLYKPRSLEMESAVSRFLEVCNRHLPLPLSAGFKTLDRGAYGWSTFVGHRACDSEQQVSNYFFRQGMWNALFYFLCTTDIHAGNIIACGEYPVPIDLEAVLTPNQHIPLSRNEFSRRIPDTYFSCFGTGMTPSWYISKDRKHTNYSSGIGGSRRNWVRPLPFFSHHETATLRLEHGFRNSQTSNLPLLDGKPVPPDAWLYRITAGFEAMYRFFLSRKEELLAENSPLAVFKNIPVRKVIRSTQDYSDTLFFNIAPDNLFSGAHYYVATERICSFNPVFASGQSFPGLLSYEKESLYERDIPVFKGISTSTAAFKADEERLGEVLLQSPFEQMQVRIAEASAEDMAWQKSIVATAFTMTVISEQNRQEAGQERGGEPQDILREAVADIARALQAQAIQTPEGARWLNIVLIDYTAELTDLAACDGSLYEGSAGVALFLLHAGRYLGDESLLETARQALRFSLHWAKTSLYYQPMADVNISVFEGVLSAVYASMVFYEKTKDTAYLSSAREIVLLLTPAHFSGKPVDYMGGRAGAVVLLVQLYEVLKETQVLQLAVELAEKLRVLAYSASLKTGFAHGASGVALALFGLFRHTGNEAYREAALHALSREREYLRHASAEVQQHPATAGWWCNGAPGMGMVRLKLLEFMDDESLRRELEQAISATHSSMPQAKQHLCCGQAGRVAFLLDAARTPGRDDLRVQAEQAALGMVQAFRREGKWHLHPFGEGNILPGLMAGCSGVGMALLQVLDEEVNSVLMLSSTDL